jgi:hypothetical protein
MACGLNRAQSDRIVLRALRNGSGKPHLTLASSIWFELGLRRDMRKLLYPVIAREFVSSGSGCTLQAVGQRFANANSIGDLADIVFPALV